MARDRVQDFYERYPYPRPVTSLENYRREWQDPARRRADFHLSWPHRPYGEARSVLVAGCGTAQAARHALRWPSAQVVGIDFSAASVRSTEALKEKYGLDNLHVRQLALERVGELGLSFDQVVCTGVLHHLPDPDAGLKALAEVLKPGGALHLMVYAPYGRAGIYLIQAFCRLLGIGATDQGIRELIQALGSLPAGHPLATLLREAPDFRQEAALADALLHPQDRAYSVPELFAFLGRAGLGFVRWLRQAPYSPRCGVLARIPQASRLAELPPEEQDAAAELFRGTLVTHSLVACRTDSAPPPVTFEGRDWLAYVPVRTPDTIAVQERLPAGAAAVLINRGHTCTDLVHPVDRAGWQLFQAIDGERTIGAILGASGDPAFARAFFEQLWCYDQVVFDASRRRGPDSSLDPADQTQGPAPGP